MVTLRDLAETLTARQTAYNRRLGQWEAVKAQYDRIVVDMDQIEADIKLGEQVRYLLHKTSEKARETARQALEDTVTNALQFVFGPEYRFVIEIEQKGGRTEATFYVESPAPRANPEDPEEMMRLAPEDSRGGGIVDIVGLTLRLAVMRINQQPKVADILVLDEPAKMLSSDYSRLTADFLKWASAYFKMQIIMVTHNEDLAAVADRSFLVQQTNGNSRIVGGASGVQGSQGAAGADREAPDNTGAGDEASR